MQPAPQPALQLAQLRRAHRFFPGQFTDSVQFARLSRAIATPELLHFWRFQERRMKRSERFHDFFEMLQQVFAYVLILCSETLSTARWPCHLMREE